MLSTLIGVFIASLSLQGIVGAARATAIDDADANVRRVATKDPDDIFPNQAYLATYYNDWAICKDKINKKLFPQLSAPTIRGGCVRYYRYVDITGVVTELHFFRRDGIHSACDCIAKCLERPKSCTNWVYKHTFMPEDGGFRSCTLYSSPNLPSNVTLAYDLKKSSGYQLLQTVNNPQAGANVPLTFLDSASTKQDIYGVSGFIVIDQVNHFHC